MNNKIFYSIALGLLFVGFSMNGMQSQFKKAVEQGNMCVVTFFLKEGAKVTDDIIKAAREAKQEKMVMFLLREKSKRRVKEHKRRAGEVGKEEFSKIGDVPEEYAKEEKKGMSFQEMMKKRFQKKK